MSAKDHQWFRFWTRTWLADPQVRSCTDAERGALIDLMCLAHQGDPYGYLSSGSIPLSEKDIANSIGMHLRTLRKRLVVLLRKRRINVFIGEQTQSELGVNVELKPSWTGFTCDLVAVHSQIDVRYITEETPLYFIPRMVTDGIKYKKAQVDGGKGGNPQLLKNVKPPVNYEVNLPLKVESESESDTDSDQSEMDKPPATPQGGGGTSDQLEPDTPRTPAHFVYNGAKYPWPPSDFFVAKPRIRPCSHIGRPGSASSCPKCLGLYSYYEGEPKEPGERVVRPETKEPPAPPNNDDTESSQRSARSTSSSTEPGMDLV